MSSAVDKVLWWAVQVYHTEAGTRHKFFRVYPYVKQLRRWIKNKRKEQSSSKHASAASHSSTAHPAVSIQMQEQQEQQHQSSAVLPEGTEQQSGQQDPSEGPANSASEEAGLGSAIPKPAPVTHCNVPEQPGQAWLKFALDKPRVLQLLKFSAMPQSAH